MAKFDCPEQAERRGVGKSGGMLGVSVRKPKYETEEDLIQCPLLTWDEEAFRSHVDRFREIDIDDVVDLALKGHYLGLTQQLADENTTLTTREQMMIASYLSKRCGTGGSRKEKAVRTKAQRERREKRQERQGARAAKSKARGELDRTAPPAQKEDTLDALRDLAGDGA
jgi:hypothetical protein